MAARLNRAELNRFEKRELQLTVLAVVFVLVLAGGLAASVMANYGRTNSLAGPASTG